MRIPHLAALALVALSCSCPAPTPTAPAPAPGRGSASTGPGSASTGPAADRAPAVPPDHPQHARVEGAEFQNGCSADADCHVGGCSQEVCSAEEGVGSTCEAPVDGWASAGAGCGCVAGQCSWFRAGSGAPATPPPPAPQTPPTPPASGAQPTAAPPGQGQPCDAAGRCAAGLSCLSYYGIAGPSGPKFTSCEVTCGKGDRCPDGQRCITIADGPGRVCRP